MKKIFTLCLLAGIATIAAAQIVPRDKVILEIGTGTWCTYCPGAAMGADDLVEAGAHIGVAENHNGDPFANQYSDARNSYYGISGFPTAKFDGILTFVGGDHYQSMFGNYLPLYQQRIVLNTNLAMTMTMEHTGLDYTATITMTKMGTLPGTNLKLRFYATVSNIQYNWQGQTHLEFVNALMVPDANGTAVDFTSGNTQVTVLDFSIGDTWGEDNVEFLAFVQNDQGKEILQGVKLAAVDLAVDFTADNQVISKNTPVTFTSEVTGGYIHSPVRYHWIFPGATPDTSNLESPVVTYQVCGPHDVTLVIDKGGQVDTVLKTEYITVGPLVNIATLPDDTMCMDQSIILDATTPNAAAYSWMPGGATTPTYEVTYPEYGLGSHSFTCTVLDNDGCSNMGSVTIFVDNCTGIGDKPAQTGLAINPNPNNGRFTVNLNTGTAGKADLTLSGILGDVVWQEKGITWNGSLVKEIAPDALRAGVYVLTVKTETSRFVQKVVVR